MLSPISASAHNKYRPTHTKGHPPNGYEILQLILDIIEGLPEIQQIIDSILERRRNARPGYPPSAMVRLHCLKFLLNERFTVQLLERLRSSPQLLELCGLDDVPSESTVSRFFKDLADSNHLLESATVSVVNQVREYLPDMGETIGVDGTDVRSYANPQRKPHVDPDAKVGYRTPKNKTNLTKSSRKDERYLGYRVVVAVDTKYELPLSSVMTPGNTNEILSLKPLVSKMQSAYAWLRPTHLVGDRGFDSVSNHQFLAERSIVPVIPLRRPANAKLHQGIYAPFSGAPTCLGGQEMKYVHTDPETGKHLYRCPPSGCDKFRDGRHNILVRCEDGHWEDPKDNLRVTGVIPRQSAEFWNLYNRRQSVERFFSSAKRSRLLNKSLYLTKAKVKAHTLLSILNYLSTVLARLKMGDADRMRQMRIRL